MKRTLFFLVLTLFSVPSSAAISDRINDLLAKAKVEKIAQSRAWLNLGHYRKNIWGNYVSEADGSSFFVSANGKSDPEAELEATLKGFFSTDKRDLGKDQPLQSVRCQYPARWTFLSGALSISENEIPPQDCAEFKKFQIRSQASSITMIFASYNVSNPSSTFGHSLMRLNKSSDKKSSPLLDLGVNYAANPTTSNPLLYAIFGMTGTFPGTFAAMPYFYKVREYSDFDARDLWEYDLNLTQDQVDMLVAHLWELAFTYFDYYFFTENCSYHMLSLLDVANPQLELLDRTRYWVIPADTIKTIARTPGLLKKVNYRPSINRILTTRLDKFDESSDRKYYFEMAQDFDLNHLPADIGPQRQAQVLDAVIDRFDSQYFEELVNENTEIKSKKNKLLIARSKLPSTTDPKIEIDPQDQPHLSHDSSRWGFTHLRSTNSVSRFEIQRRFALHDYLDSVYGYPENAKIEFFSFTVSGSWDRTDFYLKNLDFMSVQTSKPVNSFDTPLSWRGRFALDRINDERCEMCLAGTGEGGAGLSFALFDKTYAYFLAMMDARTSPDFNNHKITVEGGPLVGLRAVLYPNLIFQSEASKSWILRFEKPTTRFNANLRWSPNLKWAIDAGYREELFSNNYLGSIYYYF